MALWNPSLGGGTPLFERSEVRVGRSGASGGAAGLGITLSLCRPSEQQAALMRVAGRGLAPLSSQVSLVLQLALPRQ